MQNNVDIAATYYGTWEALLELITRKLAYYMPILHHFKFLQIGGPHPGNFLDPSHPAYFTDEIAGHCLHTYDPEEPLDHALERCIVDLLHKYDHR